MVRTGIVDWSSGRLPPWLVPLTVWALPVGLAVWGWSWTARLQRAEADRGFAQRTEVGADFTSTYLAGITSRQKRDAEVFLSGRTDGQQRFDLFSAAGPGYENTGLLDGRGRLIVASPPLPRLVGRDFTALAHVRAAMRGNLVAVSNVYQSPVLHQALVAIAVPYETPYGRRIFAGGFIAARSLLGEYLLSQTRPPEGGRSYYVDRNGNVAAATVGLGRQVTPLARLAPRLAGALGRRPAGEYRTSGVDWRYTSAAVGSTPWRLVTEVPERRLFAGPYGAQRRFATVLTVATLAGLGGALIVGATTSHRRLAQLELRQMNQRYVRQAVELQNTNDRLESVIRELESFSYSVAHDLRAPLRAMSGYSEILMDDRGIADPADRMSDDEVVGLLSRVEASAVKMAELIDALLAFSRLQRQQLTMRTVDLTALTRDVWEGLAAERADRDIEFDLADLPPCRGDSVLLRQVMVNLLHNAIKFTCGRTTAHIEVGGHPGPEGFTSYFVRDNGVGFDPSHADQLFKPFHRLHPPGAYEGIGVGLSFVQRIITRHSGAITAQSVPGEHTAFFFTLPSAAAHPSGAAEPDTQVTAPDA